MSLGQGDLGILGKLAEALGVFGSGSPNADWFSNPDTYLKRILANPAQRTALLDFVDEALGGADNTIENGVTWVPLIKVPDLPLMVAMVVDERPSDGLYIGIGLKVTTAAPVASSSTLSIPLFCAKADGKASTGAVVLLGSPRGRIRLGSQVTVSGPPVPGQARLGAIGLTIDLPTGPGAEATFGLNLTGLQMPGAATPRDVTISAAGADELDDALLDLVLSLVKAQADAAGAPAAVVAFAGLLGLKGGDAVPDFPITLLPVQGVHALSAWMRSVVENTSARNDWLGYLGSLLGGTRVGSEVQFTLGVPRLSLGLSLGVSQGPSGHALLRPRLAVRLGVDAKHVQAVADLMSIDLVTGDASALPTFGAWAAMGDAASPLLDLPAAPPAPAVRADSLRIGFAVDAARRLNLVLAADAVDLGSHHYPVLDLTSPDVVMDAVGNSVADVANELLGNLGAALAPVQQLLGLTPPPGVTAITLPALMTDPVAAVAGYWQQLIGNPAAAVAVLQTLRQTLADATEAASVVQGSGSATDPWRLPLIGPLALEVSASGSVLTVAVAASTSVDTLGQHCTVVDTRVAATLVRVDLAARSAQLLLGAAAALTARERGVNPPRARLALNDGTDLIADQVGLAIAWTPTSGLRADVRLPNPRLVAEGITLPLALPSIDATGQVVLPPAAWDAVQMLIGHLAGIVGAAGGVRTALGDIVEALGWDSPADVAGGDFESRAALRLADLVADPAAALRAWLPGLLLSHTGERALALLADVLGGSGPLRAVLLGRGTPDDPHRVVPGHDLPELVLWFPPAGPQAAQVAAPAALQLWRPGDREMPFDQLENALRAEAEVADDVADLLLGRSSVAAGWEALVQRWSGGDGRVAPPSGPVDGIDLRRTALAAGQLHGRHDIEDLTGRIPTTTVHVALGTPAECWPDGPDGRVIDLSSAGLDATMFTLPTAATGDWLVALGTRAACRPAGSPGDGTAEQAARLTRWLAALAAVSTDIAVVALAGAGHAARLAADAQVAVTDLVLLGTPLTPISLTALDTQPTADALRLLQSLLPAAPAGETESEPEDAELALGRALVAALMELASLDDAGADLRPPVLAPPATRAGLTVTAQFGVVPADRVRQAITAIVAAGLAGRAHARVAAAAATPPPLPTGIRAGLRWRLPERNGGLLAIDATADLSLLSADLGAAGLTRRERVLRLRLSVADRSGWLAATPTLSLRAVSADITLPLDGVASGHCLLTLHDGSVFGQRWERLQIGSRPALGGLPAVVQPALPEARVLLATLAQRLTADVTGPSSVALADVLEGLGLLAPAGGIVAGALDQLVFDVGGLVRQRLALAGGELSAALAALLGPLAIDIDFGAGTVALQGGDAASGRFGWSVNALLGPAGLGGQLKIGPDAALPMVGGVQLQIGLAPFSAALVWHHAGGGSDTAALWPAPDAQALARMLAHAAPGLGAQVALELMRRADDSARPLIDAVLDAFGFLDGVAGDQQRSLRPLVGLLRDPLGWLGNAGSLAAHPARIQALFDAIRPLMDLPGSAGSPLQIANGVSLAVAADAAGARLTLLVDPAGWVAPDNGGARLSGGIGASLLLQPGIAPVPALALRLGLAGAVDGRQAVHAALGAGGLQVFLRPSSGPDIALVPFAGLGSLAAAAQAALPFLLDQLAGLPTPVGPLVSQLGDALALRNGAPAHFDGDALRAWAEHPADKLRDSSAALISSGLTALAGLVDGFTPPEVAVSHVAGTVNLQIGAGPGAFTLGYRPVDHMLRLSASDITVPGINRLGFVLAVSDLGLRELSLLLGPAAIDAGAVVIEPFICLAAGAAPSGGRRVLVGLAAGPTERFAVRWLLDPMQFALVASNGPVAASTEVATPSAVAMRIVDVLIDLAAAVAMAQPKVGQLLDQTVSGSLTVRNMMRGVLLQDVANPAALINQPFDPAQIPARIRKLIGNLAAAPVKLDLGDVSISFAEVELSLGLQISIDSRFPLITGDVSLWLENDDSWITPNPPGNGGLFVGFMPKNGNSFAPKLVVNGLGLRLGKSTGPLIDAGISIESVALHAYAAIDSSGITGGGVQLQFANLAVPTAGAGGSNGIAQGVMRDTGPTPPQPAFSPALAVQQHGSGAVAVSLRAGDPPGPWWIAIQQGFGPLYIEQVGFDARVPANGKLERVSVLMDGSVSMFGLTCSVDDLQITYFTADGDFLDSNNWRVDLAGLAVAADIGGVSIAGGLLKQETSNGSGHKQIEYLGMLLGRFAVYGLTIYGGYGEGVDEKTGQKFTAFFAIGAVNGPIGGPPAFFLTGIGGGFGINRLLRVTTDLSKFADYPLIKALDIAASPSDPMTQLRELGNYFPMSKGTFWFAAGLSFNSFALVDGIAVVSVQIGDGLDINLLGLARMALPRPQVALVSIEVALVVRFSSSEGVLWVQGQLTDNSWLLYPDIKLTGGFAYVIWFGGERAGEFVLTLGGYHPDFSRPGYPVVPRLGLRWSIGSNIVIKAGSYFALTSEALMAGGDFEGSATFGPAWAEVKFGAHGIVYFDPFSYHVNAYCRIGAGITVDTYIFGEVTISISVGARIDVRGPEFRGSVTFEVGPVELTFDFGGADKASEQTISAAAFIAKYLEANDNGAARAHALMTASGAQPSKGEDATPDGSSSRPFVVVVEFGMTMTSTVPASKVRRVQGSGTTTHSPSRALAVGPMGHGVIEPEIVLTWSQDGAVRPFPFQVTARPFSRFPIGVWGPKGDLNNRKVPKGDMVEALNELDLLCTASASGGGPEIAYFQVEIGKRLPLPFTRSVADVGQLRVSAESIAALVGEPATVDAAFGDALGFMSRTASPTSLAALRGERQAPPRPGTLAEGLESPTKTTIPGVAKRPSPKVYDHFIDAPVAVAIFPAATSGLTVASRVRTTVKDSARAWRVAPPTLAQAMSSRSRSIPARLVLAEAPAIATSSGRTAGTVISASEVPLTAVAHAPTAVVARSGAPLAAPLLGFSQALLAGKARATAANDNRGAVLGAAECVVLKLPNAHADVGGDQERPQITVSGAPARLVLIDIGGQRLADVRVGSGALSVPQGTETIVAIGLGDGLGDSEAKGNADAGAGLAGWHAGLRMHYAGRGCAVAPGCVLHSTTGGLAAHRERAEAGWVTGAEMARGITTVSTQFSSAPRTVLVLLDDPAVTGLDIGSRQLVLGLDGATRSKDAAGRERAPLLLTMDNRSVLAYDIVAERDPAGGARTVVVSVASEQGWSLVGVMGSDALDPQGALNLIAARGLQAALLPLAARTVSASNGGGLSRLAWTGPLRSDGERRAAQALASGLAAAPPVRALRAGQPAAAPRRPASRRKDR